MATPHQPAGGPELTVALARMAGEVHDRLLNGDLELDLTQLRPARYYLDRLLELGVVKTSEADQRAAMVDGAGDENAPVSDIEDLKRQVGDGPDASPVAVAIAGVAARSAASAPLRSVAGADAFGALLGGVSGAVAGEMVPGDPKGRCSAAASAPSWSARWRPGRRPTRTGRAERPGPTRTGGLAGPATSGGAWRWP